MRNYFKILSLLKGFKKEIVLSVIFNILLAVFSIASLGLLIPLLDILFNQAEGKEFLRPEYADYGLNGIKDYLLSYLNYWIAETTAEKGKQYVLVFIVSVGGVMFFIKNLSRYLGTYFIVNLKNGVEKKLRVRIHKKLLSLDTAFFTEKKKGDIMARMTTDLHEIQIAILSYIDKLVQDPLMIILTMIVLFIFSWKLTLFVLIVLPIAGFVISIIANKLKKPSFQSKIDLSNILSRIEENITSMPIIKSYTIEDKVQERFTTISESYRKNMNDLMHIKNLSSPVSEFLGYVVIALIIWWGGTLIISESDLQPNVFITYILMFFQIIAPAKSISNAFYEIKKGEASIDRVIEFLELEPTIFDKENAIEINEFRESIEIEHLSFAYEESNVLQDINLRIDKGKTYALVGQSGSGKSTLAGLLNRFYDPSSGVIKIDGHPYPDIKIDDLRKLIGYISQEAILFDDTLKENLRVGKVDATDQEIIDALKSANAYDFIMEKEGQLDTMIGERGGKLSGGQKQRIVIARALLKNPEILILDEATSALDSESEKWVQDALDKILEGRTAIVIAHRLSTIQEADEIIVMRDGRIVERGNHFSLLELNGEYKKFFELQKVS